jgi:hypothetical protein
MGRIRVAKRFAKPKQDLVGNTKQKKLDASRTGMVDRGAMTRAIEPMFGVKAWEKVHPETRAKLVETVSNYATRQSENLVKEYAGPAQPSMP